MRRGWASIVAATLFALAFGGSARADTLELREPSTDFVMTIDGGTALLCPIRPQLGTPTDVCESVAKRMDLTKLETAFAIAAVVHDDWTLAVVGARTKAVSKNRPTDSQVSLVAVAIESYLVRSGTALGIAGRKEGSKYDELTIANARAIRYGLELLKRPGMVQESVSIFADGAAISVSFVAPKVHLDELRAFVDATVGKITVRPPPVLGPKLLTKPTPPAPEPIKHPATAGVVAAVGAAGILVLAIVGTLWWRSFEERQRSVPQRAARASWLAGCVVFAILTVVSKLTAFPGLVLGCVVVAAAVLFAGLSFASYALISVPRAGREGVLQPALIGLGLLIAFAALFLVGVMKGLSGG